MVRLFGCAVVWSEHGHFRVSRAFAVGAGVAGEAVVGLGFVVCCESAGGRLRTRALGVFACKAGTGGGENAVVEAGVPGVTGVGVAETGLAFVVCGKSAGGWLWLRTVDVFACRAGTRAANFGREQWLCLLAGLG